ncbi:hypothetical protein GCM10009737_32680 [Nocardioides lentus]|uniref:LPXTG cell wall anchor domain-containing protein n=1 Tax=Nocardioides lentus TaxID=338077 RepID=A0ABP5B2F0_9ACTN
MSRDGVPAASALSAALATVLAAVLTATVLLGAGAASAASPTAGAPRDPIGLSPDGVRYADALEGPLFGRRLAWVPGDRRTRSWWVRNQAEQAALLTVEVPARGVLPGWLSLQTRVGGAWRALDTAAPVTTGRLAPGASRRVAVRVTMRPTAGNRTMLDDADLPLRVRLTEARGATPGGPDTAPGDGGGDGGGDGDDGSGPGDGGSAGGAGDGSGSLPGAGGARSAPGGPLDGLLPDTGAGSGPALLLLGAALLAAGASVLRRRWRGAVPAEATS